MYEKIIIWLVVDLVLLALIIFLIIKTIKRKKEIRESIQKLRE